MLNIILIGPQGSGKGTQAELILKEYGLTQIEMGALIRKRAKLHDRKAEVLDHLVNKKGILLPDGVVLDFLFDEVEERKNVNGYLFDGFPRTVGQYLALKDFFLAKKFKLNAGIYLYISDTEAIKRLGARRLCSICKKGYSLFLEPKRTICDCGGELIKRLDDEPEAISKRLALFHKETEPILSLMEIDGILKKINGEQIIQNIWLDIKKELQPLLV